MRAQSAQNQTRMGMDRADAAIRDWSSIILRGTLALLVGLGAAIGGIPIGGLHEGLAQTSGFSSQAVAGFTPGQVTAVQGKTVQINGKNYELKANVVIQDEEGKPMEPGEIVPGAEVKFHLKEGQIDQMVLILPK